MNQTLWITESCVETLQCKSQNLNLYRNMAKPRCANSNAEFL